MKSLGVNPSRDRIAADAPAVIRNQMEATHKDRICDFASFEAAERAMTKFIRDSVDEI